MAVVLAAATSNSAESRLLTNAAQIIQLPAEQAEASLPVRIEGVVTCYDHGRVMFVQDETAGVFVYYTGDRLPLRSGQPVQITGFAKSGRYSPIIDSPVIQTLGSGMHVEPKPVTMAQLQFGGLDAQWVELTGVVRGQKLMDGVLLLELADAPHRTLVWVSPAGDYRELALPGKSVRIRGVVGSLVKDRGQLEGFQLFANSTADITVLRSPADPLSTPLRLVRDFKRADLRSLGTGSVRVRGTVTLRWAGAIFIQDDTGGLEVQTHSPLEGVSPGMVVEAAGYPGPILEAPRVEDALIRPLATNALPKPLRLTPDDLRQDRHDNRLVEIEAEFLGQADTPSNHVALALHAGDGFLSAFLDSPSLPGPVSALQPGTRLRLTGVLRSRASVGNTRAAYLLMRSPADISIVSRPVATRTPSLKILAAVAMVSVVGLSLALWFIQKQRRRTEHMLQLQSALQLEMRQGEQQLRRSMEERERIARDLHDDIIQSIYAAGLGLEDCRRMISQSPTQAETRLATAIQTLNDTIRGVRGFIDGLEPKVLNGREFKTALKSLALTSGESPTQFEFHVDPTGANSLTSTQATQLLHIAKEAMSNSLRHAHASSVSVSLQPSNTGVRLEIRDDGVGFRPGAIGISGQGLRNMAARAREMGGEMQTISSPGEGCCILITVPQRSVHEPN